MGYRVLPKGDCDKCPAAGVDIHFGYSTRDNKHCIKCNGDRLQAIKMDRARTRPRKVEIVKYRPPKQRIPITPKPTDALRELRQLDDRVNKEIWATREHRCFECGRWLAVSPPPKEFFSHVLSKGAHPELRHDPENIVLHCPKCHRNWETAGNERREMRTYVLKIAYMESHGFVPKD